MSPFVSDDATVYIGAFIGLWLLLRLKGTLPRRGSTSAVFFRKMITFLTLVLIVSVVFYWKLRRLDQLPPGIETWLLGLDIILAHAVVTLPILLIIVFLLYEPVKIGTYIVLDFTVFKIHSGTAIWLLIYLPGFVMLVIWYFAVKLLLVDTLDLQMLLFGEFDPGLGWQPPTTFGLSVLSAHIAEIPFSANKVIVGIVAVFMVFSGIILGTSNIMKALDNIGEKTKQAD